MCLSTLVSPLVISTACQMVRLPRATATELKPLKKKSVVFLVFFFFNKWNLLIPKWQMHWSRLTLWAPRGKVGSYGKTSPQKWNEGEESDNSSYEVTEKKKKMMMNFYKITVHTKESKSPHRASLNTFGKGVKVQDAYKFIRINVYRRTKELQLIKKRRTSWYMSI